MLDITLFGTQSKVEIRYLHQFKTIHDLPCIVTSTLVSMKTPGDT